MTPYECYMELMKTAHSAEMDRLSDLEKEAFFGALAAGLGRGFAGAGAAMRAGGGLGQTLGAFTSRFSRGWRSATQPRVASRGLGTNQTFRRPPRPAAPTSTATASGQTSSGVASGNAPGFMGTPIGTTMKNWKQMTPAEMMQGAGSVLAGAGGLLTGLGLMRPAAKARSLMGPAATVATGLAIGGGLSGAGKALAGPGYTNY